MMANIQRKEQQFVVEIPQGPVHYIGKVKLNSNFSIRLLILKHCRESVADKEGRTLVQVANLAASKGLTIKEIGNYHVDKKGAVDRLVWGEKMDIEGLEKFVDEQMKVGKQEGDTLIIYTTGHGAKGGWIQILGSRHDLGMAFARCAEKNNQETVWWQSSCYAAAGLPKMSDFNEKQKSLMSMIASSPANQVSYWGDQPPRIQKVFEALAANDSSIDPDGDGVVVAQELANFMNSRIKRGSGDLLYAKSPDEPIFGFFDVANKLPILNPNGQPFIPDEDRFIPYPRFRN